MTNSKNLLFDPLFCFDSDTCLGFCTGAGWTGCCFFSFFDPCFFFESFLLGSGLLGLLFCSNDATHIHSAPKGQLALTLLVLKSCKSRLSSDALDSAGLLLLGLLVWPDSHCNLGEPILIRPFGLLRTFFWYRYRCRCRCSWACRCGGNLSTEFRRVLDTRGVLPQKQP